MAEKLSLEKDNNPNAEVYITKIDSLETKILKLSEELRQARMSQVLMIRDIFSPHIISLSGSAVVRDQERSGQPGQLLWGQPPGGQGGEKHRHGERHREQHGQRQDHPGPGDQP